MGQIPNWTLLPPYKFKKIEFKTFLKIAYAPPSDKIQTVFNKTLGESVNLGKYEKFLVGGSVGGGGWLRTGLVFSLSQS